MPVVQKEDIQRLLFNTIKSIMTLEKEKKRSPEQNTRLEKLREFRKKLVDFAEGTGIRLKPSSDELKRHRGMPESEVISDYTFPTTQPEVTPDADQSTQTPEEPIESASPITSAEQTTPTPQVAPPVEQRPARSFKGSTTATIARPRVGQEQKEKIPLKELQDIRRRLQRSEMAIVRKAQGKEGVQLEELQKERDRYSEALNAAISLERQRYEEKPSLKPDDWDVSSPKSTPWKKLSEYAPIDLDKLPDALQFAQQQQQTFSREPGQVPGGKGKGQKFINADIRRIINDISGSQKEIDKLDPRIEGDRTKIESYEKNIDNLKGRLRYLQSIKDIGIEDKFLSNEYNTLAKQLEGYLSPEQMKAYKEGQQININSIGNKQGFLRTIRELGRELDKIHQANADEMTFLQASPTNTAQEFRSMPVEERRSVLDEVKRENFMKQIAEGVDDYYMKRRKSSDPQSFDELSPEAQQSWTKRFAASEARRGAPGMTGSDIYKYLFGGGEQFISKYPPELYNTMVRAARSGFGGMEQASRRIGSLAMQDPYQLVYGEQAPAQRQFITGVGQAPMVPQLPQEYAYTPPASLQQMLTQPNQQQQANLPQLLQEGLQQGPSPIAQTSAETLPLSQLLQQAPPTDMGMGVQPIQPVNVDPINQLINARLENLLKGV